MVYLSQLILNPRSPYVRGDLANCHAMHQRILSAFPDEPDVSAAREHYGVLYRVEPSDGGARILVQSRVAPDWSRLPAGYLRKPPSGPKPIDALYEHITVGQMLTFRLRANPTRCVSQRNTEQTERRRGKRVDLRREEDQFDWLRRKGETGGFALLEVRSHAGVADVRTRETAVRAIGRDGDSRLTFGSALFEGRLRVTDSAAFLRTLERGVGSGKAFGFGLLSIAPARASS